MELSAYYMPGLGGRALWRENALETADLMNQVDPDFIRLRTVAVPDRVPLAEDLAAGAFVKGSDVDNAREIVLFLENLQGIRSKVVTDHILNISQHVEGRLPEDREGMLDELRPFSRWTPRNRWSTASDAAEASSPGCRTWPTPSPARTPSDSARNWEPRSTTSTRSRTVWSRASSRMLVAGRDGVVREGAACRR